VSHFEMKLTEAFKLLLTQILGLALVLFSFPDSAFAYLSAKYLSPHRGPASINRAALTMVTPSKIFYGEDGKALSPELIANFNMVKHENQPYDMSQLIPLDMQPSDSSSQVFSQVADKSFTTILNSDAVRGSTLGRAATDVEQKLKTEVTLGGNEPKSIQHKLNFSMQAFQATAQVLYTGITHAALKYKIADNKVGLEVFERVVGNKDLVMSHTVSPADRLSEVSVRWNF